MTNKGLEVQWRNARMNAGMADSGMVTSASEVHSSNAPSSMVTPAGMATEVSEVHPENAQISMVVTPSGMVTEVSEVQSENA